MKTIVLSLLTVLVGGAIIAWHRVRTKTRLQYQDFVKVVEAVISISKVEDIAPAFKDFDRFETTHSFCFTSALMSLESTWDELGIKRRDFDEILMAITEVQDMLDKAKNDAAKNRVREISEDLVKQIIAARHFRQQQVVLGSAARVHGGPVRIMVARS